MRAKALCTALVCCAGFTVAAGGTAAAEEPFYMPPGELLAGSGKGRVDLTVYTPNMRYPTEEGPSFPNSQVWGVGGAKGPAGSQCDTKNYSYPWRDNYCETRSWDMPLCPSGAGHQGQDIRAKSCQKAVHWTVAARPATVTNIQDQPGDYALYITGADGTRWDYLHGEGGVVSLGQKVEPGQRLDKVSNSFGGTPTSIHLHFNIKQDVAGYGYVYVPPYMSLVEGYKDLMGLGSSPPQGAFEAAECDVLRGWAQDPDDPEASVDAILYFDGLPSDPDNIGVQVRADLHRDDLCQSLGSCAHGFAVEMPRSLRDGLEHTVYVFAADSGSGPPVEIEGSPRSISCAPPPIPSGVRRWLVSPEVVAAWQLSPFWDMAKPGDAAVAALPVGPSIAAGPTLVRGDDGAPEVWLIDEGLRRWVPSPEIAARWGLDLASVEVWPAAEVAALPHGPNLRPEPFMIKGSSPHLYLLDDPLCLPGDPSPLCAPEPEPTGTSGGSAGDSGDTEGSGSDSGDSGSVASDSGGSAAASADDAGAGSSALPPGYGQDAADDGCGCRSDPSGDALWGGMLVLGALWRRRRAH